MKSCRDPLLALAAALLLTASPMTRAENERVMLVLDASGSMWAQIDGRSKVEIARDAIAEIVRDWNSEHHLGLVAYGHRRRGDCEDIETILPPGPLDARAFMDRVNSLNARGMTPLSQAVIHAAGALRYGEQRATVILVSDGEENCGLDPCAVGAELERAGVEFTAHVIGFDIGDPAHQAQLRCLAENTGGQYFNARDAAELNAAVRGAVSASTQVALPPAEASLEALEDAVITRALSIGWTGPGDEGDYITVVVPGEPEASYINYAYVRNPDGADRGELQVLMPAMPGEYELRYVSPLRNPRTLARAPVSVSDLEASIEAPDSAMAGTSIELIPRGPVSPRHWVGFAPVGSDDGTYINNHWVRLGASGQPLSLRVPAMAGDYELRYVYNESERVAYSRPFRVLEVHASVEGPPEVMTGELVLIHALGPIDGGHWIGFAPAGSDAGAYISGSYARPSPSRESVTVNAPDEPGEYEYRYVLYEAQGIAASAPVRVVPARATLSAPTSASAGARIEIGFTGPRGSGNWIGIVPAGDDGSNYETWSRLPADGDSVGLWAPREAGEREIVFVQGSTVLARIPFRVE